MDFDYTPEQEQLRREYRERLEAVMTPERRTAVSGRTEGSALEQYIFAEEARRVNAPLPMMITLNTVGPTLMQSGSEEQKNRFLPAILKGAVEFAIGYSEPGAGSDPASLRTTAVRDGDEYVINGSKMFTSGLILAPV